MPPVPNSPARALALALSVALSTLAIPARAQDPAPAPTEPVAPAPTEPAPAPPTTPPAQASVAGTAAHPLSVEDALRLAQQASERIDIAESGVEGALGDKWAAFSGYLPTVAGSVTYQRTFATEFDDLFAPSTPTTIPTGGTGGTPTGAGTTTGSTGAPTGAPSGGFELPFGQDNTWRAGFTVSQGIYGGGRAAAMSKIAQAGTHAADVGLESARAAVALDTATAYYDAVLSDRLLEIATSSLAQAEATLSQTELGQSVGRQPEFDLLRAQVVVENQQVTVISAQRQRSLAHQRLAQLLDLPPETPLELLSPLEDTGVAEVAAEVSRAAPPTAVRAPIRQAGESARISDASVAMARADGLPSLGASASVGWVSYPSTVFPIGKDKPWYSSISASVALNVPIFSGGRVYGALRRARADAASAQARVDQTAELADLDTSQAHATLEAASAQWDATEGAVEQARKAYGIAELRFAEGVSTQIELSDARLQLERALVNRAQAARDLALARTRLALIGSLPLQGAP